MATTIVTPTQPIRDESSGAGAVVGLLVLIVLTILFFVYALPALRNLNTQPNQANIELNLPTTPVPTPVAPPTNQTENPTSLQ